MRDLATERRPVIDWCHKLTRVNSRRGIDRFERISLLKLSNDVVRAARLHLQDPSPRMLATRPERVVVTLTTVPERMTRILPALRSLVDQSCPPDKVLLAVPARSARTGKTYPEPPALPERVEVLPCEDLGPATKLLPALVAEPDAVIIVTDDDVVYPEDFVEALLRQHRTDSGACLGLRGWTRRPGVRAADARHVFGTALLAPQDVDVLLGTWGYLIPPDVFDDAVHDFTGWPPEVRWVDDIWFSGHLARNKVPRRIIPVAGLPLETPASHVASLTGGINRNGRNDEVAIEAFAEFW